VSGRVWVGTSGWIYPHWRGRFYPDGLPASRQLAFLASRFSTVEVNGTFYRLAQPASFERWRGQVPSDFIFALKGSRYITHMLKLSGGAEPLGNFFAQGVLLLGSQLGPILWQLPPQLPFIAERARSFFGALPPDMHAAERLARKHDRRLPARAVLQAPDGRDLQLRHALEVRHPSWLGQEALELMAEHGVALVTADTARRHPLSFARTNSQFAYVRLHGAEELYASRYRDEELDRWRALIDGWRRRAADIYVYFDNDNKAHAPHDALRLSARLAAIGDAGSIDARV
jgi:uncharacterized protein YecE (DUF72 family)